MFQLSKRIESIGDQDRQSNVSRGCVHCFVVVFFLLFSVRRYASTHVFWLFYCGVFFVYFFVPSTVGELLLFAQDLAARNPQSKSSTVKWVAATKMWTRSQRKSGRHVLLSLFDWAFLRVYDMGSGEVYETQLPPSLSDEIKRGATVGERVDALKEYIREEELMEHL